MYVLLRSVDGGYDIGIFSVFQFFCDRYYRVYELVYVERFVCKRIVRIGFKGAEYFVLM